MKINESKASKLARLIFASFVVVCALCVMMSGSAPAQDKDSQGGIVSTDAKTQPAAQPGTPAMVANDQGDERYRIGPGDVLDIRVFNRPQLSREARVDSNGVIQMPLLEGDIRAACLTENELAKEIAQRYLKYQRNPYVNVFVKEYSSTPVAVIGAVDKPGRFQLTRRVRLLELLAFAGGPTDKAGGKIQIAHTGTISLCASPDAQEKGLFDFYSLREAMRGGKDANPFIQPGDIISIPEADLAYVVGNVFKPQSVTLKDPVTVSQAIAMAGGALRATKMSGVRIIRQKEGSTSKEVIPVDLNAISKLKTPDILLEPNDIVQVPTSEGKIFMDKFLGAMTGGLSSIPYILR
jgi:polysaccharide export outer membrane protein